jgi:hypothetical protein
MADIGAVIDNPINIMAAFTALACFGTVISLAARR